MQLGSIPYTKLLQPFFFQNSRREKKSKHFRLCDVQKCQKINWPRSKTPEHFGKLSSNNLASEFKISMSFLDFSFPTFEPGPIFWNI